MDKWIVPIAVAIFASTGFWTLISTLILNNKNNKNAERQALLGLLHDRIYELGNSYIRQQSITSDEYDNFVSLYLPYEKLGGNGTGKKIKTEVDKLPMVQL